MTLIAYAIIELLLLCTLCSKGALAQDKSLDTVGLYYEWIYQFDEFCKEKDIQWWVTGRWAEAAKCASGWTPSLKRLSIGVRAGDLKKIQADSHSFKQIEGTLHRFNSRAKSYIKFRERTRYGRLKNIQSLVIDVEELELPTNLQKVSFGPLHLKAEQGLVHCYERDAFDFRIQNLSLELPEIYENPKCQTEYVKGEAAYDGRFQKFKAQSYAPARQVFEPEKIGEMYQLLALIDYLFFERDIKYWITDGTLLGAVRHGGYIPWDVDADLCCDVRHVKQIDKLKSEFTRRGLVFMKMNGERGEFVFYRIKWPKQTWLFVDIVPCKLDTEKGYYLPCQPIKRKQWHRCYRWFEKEVSPLLRVKLGPVTMNAPNDPLRYLFCHYGRYVLTKVDRNLWFNELRPKEDLYEFSYSPAKYRFVNPWFSIKDAVHDPFNLDSGGVAQ